MHQIHALFVTGSCLIVAAALFAGGVAQSAPTSDEAKGRVFEIRTYTTEPGKLPDLLKRFHDHTTKLFEKHGMTNIGYWVPTDEPRSKNTLIYILAHASRDAAKKSWDGFKSDLDWQRVQKASEASGKIVSKVESIYAEPTDFSAIK
jgi:hypothetical protein